jgi:hypothetical protein
MLQAVKDGHLITWPGLTEDAINKHLKLTPATDMGHVNQRRHNIRSTSKAPTKSSMLQAVKDGHLITWPGLTEDAINKHLKLTPATAMGHMNQRRQNIRSTSKAPIEKQPTPNTDLGTKTHLVYAVVVDQGQLYTDLTGKFPV